MPDCIVCERTSYDFQVISKPLRMLGMDRALLNSWGITV